MSDTQTKPVRFRKRYVAIAALASLIATGGIVGATVTEQSTIKNNKITVTGLDPANVTVSGTPMNLKWSAGKDMGTGELGATEYTITNTGETDAKVSVPKIDASKINLDLIAASKPVNGSITIITVPEEVGGGTATLLTQTIASSGTGNPALGTVVVSNSVTVPAKGTIKVKAFVKFSAGSDQVKATDKTFDVGFDFVNKS